MARNNYTPADVWLRMPLGRLMRFIRANNEIEKEAEQRRLEQQRKRKRR